MQESDRKPFSFLFFKKGFISTPVLIGCNIAAFLLMLINGADLISPGSDVLVNLGANLRYHNLNGEWWRAISACFIHIGLIHLAMNMYALLYIGAMLEPILGSINFAVAYLSCGVLASITSITMNPYTISAGASGAIFGMYGVFLALLLTNLIDKQVRTQLLSSILIFIAINIFYGLSTKGIDNAAHAGGLLSGSIIGFIYYGAIVSEAKLADLIAGFAVLSLAGASVFLSGKYLINYEKLYQSKFELVIANEKRAYSLLNAALSEKEQEASRDLNQGIGLWKENLRLSDELLQYKPTQEMKKRIEIMRDYFRIQQQKFELLDQSLRGDERITQEDIEALNKKSEALMSAYSKQ